MSVTGATGTAPAAGKRINTGIVEAFAVKERRNEQPAANVNCLPAANTAIASSVISPRAGPTTNPSLVPCNEQLAVGSATNAKHRELERIKANERAALVALDALDACNSADVPATVYNKAYKEGLYWQRLRFEEEEKLISPEARALAEKRGPLFDPWIDEGLASFDVSLPVRIENQIVWEENMERDGAPHIKSGLTRPAPSYGSPQYNISDLSLADLRERIALYETILEQAGQINTKNGLPPLAPSYDEKLQRMIDGLEASLDESVRERLRFVRQREAEWFEKKEVVQEFINRLKREETRRLAKTESNTGRLDNVIPFQQSKTDNASLSKHANESDDQSSNADESRKQLLALPFSNMSNWDNEPVPNREWAVPDRIPLRQTSLFSGEGGAGKSYITLHLCAAHALGRDWLGSQPVSGPTIFLDAEDDESEIRIRLHSILKHYNATHADLVKGGFHLMSRVGQDSVLGTVSRSGKIEPTPFYNQLLQAAGDIKPKMIGIASLSNIFAGSEIDRGQVQQFSGLITRLAQLANGSVLLVSHPSLVGINSDTGLSGSTQWHNSVRSRIYLKSVALAEGEQPDSDLRELVFKKLQYGALPDSTILRYQNGMFLPVQGAVSLDKEAQLETAKKAFLTILGHYDVANRTVSDKSGRNYAPAQFAKEDEAKSAGLHAKTLENAMRDLFKEHKIWNKPIGKPSRPAYQIALAPTVRQQANGISEQDSILRWAQACVASASITGTKSNLADLAIGRPATSELIYESYTKFCKKHKLCPEGETAFNKACDEMFGPPKQIRLNLCVNYPKKPINFLGYDVPDSSTWQEKIAKRLEKQEMP